MKRLIVVVAALALLTSAFALVGCGEKKVPSGAIAAVGDGVVTQAQYDAIWKQAEAQYKSQGTAVPKAGSTQYNQLRASIVNYLVQNEVITEKAKDMKVAVTDKEYNARLKLITQQVGGEKKLLQLLKKQGVGMKELKEQLMASMLQSEVQTKVYSSVKVTDAEIKAYYNNKDNQSQFVQQPTVTARHILVKTKAEAEKVRALLVADSSDANWKKVAKKYSTDPGSKNSGGSLGSFPKGRMVKAFENAAFSLKVDQISQPVKTQYGWHVIQVTKKTAGSSKTLAQAKSQIQQVLLYQKQSTAWQKWLTQATKDAGIVYAKGYDPKSLTASPSPSSSASPSK